MVERVLVTGARAVAALDMARSLRAAGYEPHLADCSPAWVARLSRTAGPVHRYGSPVERPAAFARDLRALIARLDPVRIIPACEEVFHLAALAEADGFSGRLHAPPPDRLATLHAKDRFAALCRDLSLPAPETTVVTGRAELEIAAGAMTGIVAKPVWSRFGAGARVAPGLGDLAAIAPTPDAPWIVQRRIIGEEVSFYAVCEAGRVAAFCAYGSDWRLRGGASYVFRPLPADRSARLRPLADALAAFAGSGQIACDAIIDADGQAWLIECNPRATSGVHLFGRGAAFGQALMGRGEAQPVAGVRHLAPGLWLHGLPAALRDRRLPAWRTRRREGHDVVGAPSDRLPVLGALADGTAFALRALRTGRSLTGAMTADIEWNGGPLGFPITPPPSPPVSPDRPPATAPDGSVPPAAGI